MVLMVDIRATMKEAGSIAVIGIEIVASTMEPDVLDQDLDPIVIDEDESGRANGTMGGVQEVVEVVEELKILLNLHVFPKIVQHNHRITQISHKVVQSVNHIPYHKVALCHNMLMVFLNKIFHNRICMMFINHLKTNIINYYHKIQHMLIQQLS